MSAFHKYPDIVTLDRRPEILAVKQVIATEKLHGTNFRVHFPEGMTCIADIEYGGRNETFGTGDGQGFYGGHPVRWFKEQPELLQRMLDTFTAYSFSNVTVYGEMCGANVQKGVRYQAPGTGGVIFRAFDILVGENLVTYSLFVELCDRVGLPRVPEVWRGEPSLAAFDALLEKTSIEGARNGVSEERNFAEGVVLRSEPLLRNVFGEWLLIKHKSERFNEAVRAAGKRGKEPGQTDSAVADFVATYVVAGRVINALGRLRDAGVVLKDGMEDMPHLVPAMIADLHKECEPEWQALLAQGHNDKQIRGAVQKTLATVYRRMLLEEAAS